MVVGVGRVVIAESVVGYRFCRDESVEQSVRRIAREQLDKGLEELSDVEVDSATKVHEIRKRCKKLRALIRLVRPSMEATYAEENAWYRDTASKLSFARDTQVLFDTFQSLKEHYREPLQAEAFAAQSHWLLQRRDDAASSTGTLHAGLEATVERLQEGRARAAGWSLDSNDFTAIAGGLGKTYRRARRAMKEAYAAPSPDAFHEWRKRVKYHAYHLRLLEPVWPAVIRVRREECDRLGHWLGQDHDLAVLGTTLAEHALPGHAAEEGMLQALVDHQRSQLQSSAEPLGRRLFEEKSRCFIARVQAQWDVWVGAA